MVEFFRGTPTRQDKIQILRFEPHRNVTYGNSTLERKWKWLHNQCFQRNNLAKRERAALDRLSNNREIVIKSADKGRATVILNTIDYVKEAKCQLDNEIYYNKIENDLTSEHEQLINQCIDTLKNNGELEEIAKLLKPARYK